MSKITPPSAPQPRRRRRSAGPRRHRVRWTLLTVVGFLLAGILGAGGYFLPSYIQARAQTGQKVKPAAGPANAQPGTGQLGTGQPFTVLLLGSDDDSKFARDEILTQSMILVRVTPATNQVTLLSLPRDMYVPLSTGGTDKIDKAYLHGGAGAAVATVENDFHIHVDNYVWIGLEGLVKIINVLGGIDIVTSHPVLDDYYPADLTSTNAYDYSRVAVLPGAQHLDGLHAMEYVRSRHNDLFSDLGRTQRQQQVLTAIRQKANMLSVADIPRITEAMKSEFTTDMDLTALPSLLGVAKKITPENTGHVFILPPLIQDAKVGDQDVLIPNLRDIRTLIQQTFPAA